MIRKEGDYYICDEAGPAEEQVEPPKQQAPPQHEYSTVGSIGDRIVLMRQRVDALKAHRAAAEAKPSTPKLAEVFPESWEELDSYAVNLHIPSELLQLEERIEVVERRMQPN